jgi:hypothetical protein
VADDSRPCKDTLETLAVRINALEKQVALQVNSVRDNIAVALAASEKAIIKAEIANEKRFENVNEFRATLADQQNTLLPRTEYTVQHKAMTDRIDELERLTRYSTGKGAGSAAVLSAGAIIITMLISIAAILVHFR